MTRRVGSLNEPFVVGQDPQRKQALEAQLFEDFKPKDVLEEIWLSDIAALTANIEYYRTIEAAITLKIATNHRLNERLDVEFPDDTSGSYRQAVGSASFLDTVGEFHEDDLSRISTMVDLISKIRRERERIYLLFERKRRPAVLNAVRANEIGAKEQYIIEDLSD